MTVTHESVTGRDAFIIRKALAYGIAAICRLPQRQQEHSDMRDMRAILDHICANDPLGAEFFLDNALAHLDGVGFNEPDDPRAR